MKVLVATALTQGARQNDYHWIVERRLDLLRVRCLPGELPV